MFSRYDDLEESIIKLEKDVGNLYMRLLGLERNVQKPNPVVEDNGTTYSSLFSIDSVEVNTSESEKVKVFLSPLRDNVEIIVGAYRE